MRGPKPANFFYQLCGNIFLCFILDVLACWPRGGSSMWGRTASMERQRWCPMKLDIRPRSIFSRSRSVMMGKKPSSLRLRRFVKFLGCVGKNVTNRLKSSVVDPSGMIYSESGSRYEFLEFRILENYF